MRPQLLLVAEFPCDRYCRIEFDVDDDLTREQALAVAAGVHADRHAAPDRRSLMPLFRAPAVRS